MRRAQCARNERGNHMQAFLNNIRVKQSCLARLQALRADGTIRRFWLQKGGCVLGLTIDGRQHDDYEQILGIPRQLGIVEDRIFEGLSLEEADNWPEDFLDAIAVGTDLQQANVWLRYAAWLMDDRTDGAIRFAKTDGARDAIGTVAALFRAGCTDGNSWSAAAEGAYKARWVGSEDDPAARAAADAATCPKCTAV